MIAVSNIRELPRLVPTVPIISTITSFLKRMPNSVVCKLPSYYSLNFILLSTIYTTDIKCSEKKKMANIKNNLTLTLSAAQAASQACEAKAKEIGVPMNIAVVDCSTNLLSFSR